MDEIVKIVLQRNKERKMLTNSDVKRICNIFIGLSKIESVNEINFEFESPHEGYGDYYWDSENKTGIISFYTETVEKALELKYRANISEHIFDGTKIDVYNWYYLNAIFHEFSHAKDRDLINKNKKSKEAKLAGIVEKLPAIRDFYETNYYDMPNEVKARNNGNLRAYEVYEKLPIEFLSNNDRLFYKFITLAEMKETYIILPEEEKIESPIERIFDYADDYNLAKAGIDVNQFRSLIYDKNNFTLYNRLMLGLPITYQEYGYIHILQECLESQVDVDFTKKLQKRLHK